MTLKNVHPKYPSKMNGNVMIEFLIVIPLLALLFVLIMDYSRYFSVAASMEAASAIGLRKAQVILGLDEGGLDEETQEPLNAEQIATVRQVTRDTMQSYFGEGTKWIKDISVDFELPTNDSGENMDLKTLLQHKPMEVRLEGTFTGLTPILFSQGVKITRETHGYREPIFVSTRPELVDCNGKSISSGGTFNRMNCPCPDGDSEKYDRGGGVCGCVDEPVKTLDPGSNTCVCASGYTDDGSGNCTEACQGDLVLNNGVCECPACPGNQFPGRQGNTCSCPNSCDAPDYVNQDNWDSNSCGCNIPDDGCPEGSWFWNSSSSGTATQNLCECIPCGPNTVPSGKSGNTDVTYRLLRCSCALNPADAGPNEILADHWIDGCKFVSCGAGKVAVRDAQSPNGRCECTNSCSSGYESSNEVNIGIGGDGFFGDCSCQCDVSHCGENQYVVGTSATGCFCYCSPGYTASNDPNTGEMVCTKSPGTSTPPDNGGGDGGNGNGNGNGGGRHEA